MFPQAVCLGDRGISRSRYAIQVSSPRHFSTMPTRKAVQGCSVSCGPIDVCQHSLGLDSLTDSRCAWLAVLTFVLLGVLRGSSISTQTNPRRTRGSGVPIALGATLQEARDETGISLIPIPFSKTGMERQGLRRMITFVPINADSASSSTAIQSNVDSAKKAT